MHITGKDFTEMYYFVQLPHPLLVHVSVVDLYVTMNTLQACIKGSKEYLRLILIMIIDYLLHTGSVSISVLTGTVVVWCQCTCTDNTLCVRRIKLDFFQHAPRLEHIISLHTLFC